MRLSIAAEDVAGRWRDHHPAGFLASLTPGTHEQPVWPLPVATQPGGLPGPSAAGADSSGAIAWLSRLRSRWSAAVLWRRRPLDRSGTRRSSSWLSRFPISIRCSSRPIRPVSSPRPPNSPPPPSCTAPSCSLRIASPAMVPTPAATVPPRNRCRLPPADLTAEHFWAHNDGELYWYVAHGFQTPDGGIRDARLRQHAVQRGDLGPDRLSARQQQRLRACAPPGRGRILCLCRSSMYAAPISVRSTSTTCVGDQCTSSHPRAMKKPLHYRTSRRSSSSAAAPPRQPARPASPANRKHGPHSPLCSDNRPMHSVAGSPGGPERLAACRGAPNRAGWTSPQALSARIRDITRQPLPVTLPGGHVHNH